MMVKSKLLGKFTIYYASITMFFVKSIPFFTVKSLFHGLLWSNSSYPSPRSYVLRHGAKQLDLSITTGGGA